MVLMQNVQALLKYIVSYSDVANYWQDWCCVSRHVLT